MRSRPSGFAPPSLTLLSDCAPSLHWSLIASAVLLFLFLAPCVVDAQIRRSPRRVTIPPAAPAILGPEAPPSAPEAAAALPSVPNGDPLTTGDSFVAMPAMPNLFGRSASEFLQDEINYRQASEFFTLANPYHETIHIESIEARVSDFQIDQRPVLMLVLCPFLDTFVVELANLGWGTAEKSSLQLCGPLEMTPDGQQKIVDLLDIASPICDIGKFEKKAVVVFPLGASSVPFQFSVTSSLDLSRLRPPPRLAATATTAAMQSYSDSQLVPEIRSGPAAQYSGVAYFHAELIDEEGVHEEKSYVARRMQRFRLTGEEKFLHRAIGTSADGDLFTSWGLAFGNAFQKPVYGTTTSGGVGVTFDLGDGSEKRPVEHVTIDVAPNETVEVRLDFLTQKSASFRLEVTCSYRIGKGRVQRYRMLSTQAYQTRVPNLGSLALDERGVFELVSAIRTADPEIDARALMMLKDFVHQAGEDQMRMLLDHHNTWQIADALMLASTSNTDEHRGLQSAAVDALLSAAKTQAVAEVPVAAPTCRLDECIPMLCKLKPPETVDLAVTRLISTERSDWIGICIALDEARALLPDHKERLTTFLAGRSELTTIDLALAAVLKLRRFTLPIVSEISGHGLSSKPADILLWSALRMGDKRADAAVLSRLASDRTTATEATEIIETMLMLGRGDFSEDVVAFVDAVRDKPARFDRAVLAALQYLRRFPTETAAPTLRALSNHRSNGEIRRLARELSKEQ